MSKLPPRIFPIIAAIGLSFGGCAKAQVPPAAPVVPTKAPTETSLLAPENLKPWLESVRVKSGVPALAVAVLRDGEITSVATGFRKLGDPTKVTDGDAFHLGSCTKSMTATLLAFLVEDGRLKWDDTLAEIFPKLKNEMRPELCDVTVRQLLNQRSGMTSESWPVGTSVMEWWKSKEPLTEQRAEAVKGYLAEAPEVKPGTKFIYSNRNYIIAGAIAEHITGKSWETLMRERLFEPLGMKSAGFGPTVAQDKMDGVWAHLPSDEGEKKLIPMSGLYSDNPLMLGPAGTVHCSMEDWAKYIRFVMKGIRDGNDKLPKKIFADMTTPPADGDYAFGWQVLRRGWGGDGPVLNHNGSNNKNYSVVWMAPSRNFAVMIATNAGDGAKVCDEVASGVIMELDKLEKGKDL